MAGPATMTKVPFPWSKARLQTTAKAAKANHSKGSKGKPARSGKGKAASAVEAASQGKANDSEGKGTATNDGKGKATNDGKGRAGKVKDEAANGVVGAKMEKEDVDSEKEDTALRKKRKSSTLAEPVESAAAGSEGGAKKEEDEEDAAGKGGIGSTQSSPERRFAYDGEAYTYDEFIERYGEYYGQSFWNEGIEDGKPQLYRDLARISAACAVEGAIWTETFQALSVITMYREWFEDGDAEEARRTIDQTWVWLEQMYNGSADASKKSLEAKLKEFQDIVRPITQKALSTLRPEHLRHLKG